MIGYLPDTNIVSALFKNDLHIRRRIVTVENYLSPVVLGELLQGAFFQPQRSSLMRDIRIFANIVPPLQLNFATSEYFAVIAADLKLQGIVIPPNDIWIAAQARQYDLVLATRDAHFGHVKDLKIERW